MDKDLGWLDGLLSLDDWKNIATIIGAGVALVVLIKGVYEYVKQGTQNRAEHFSKLRVKFKENESFREIAALTEDDDSKLRDLSFKEKREYLGVLEEVALAVNSNLIKPEIAHYMFGYYAIRCWGSKNFWAGVNRDSHYWIVFRKFAEKMQVLEDAFEYDEKKLRF